MIFVHGRTREEIDLKIAMSRLEMWYLKFKSEPMRTKIKWERWQEWKGKQDHHRKKKKKQRRNDHLGVREIRREAGVKNKRFVKNSSPRSTNITKISEKSCSLKKWSIDYKRGRMTSSVTQLWLIWFFNHLIFRIVLWQIK